ncbi:polysaccharide deacetylase family protein [Mucilaginibacter rubeus]|uniref:Polysaccharide deacetylase family protein n=1 Tax=Mucilaginibacter rubeus TaxID=2027860 RepID=A0AAE6MGE8_9SPHI|nr:MULTISPECIES: polysaccharide deacetylase family protein [Mucilaginibacter]QEM02388.1 polysaccharide deacetylase family protein [Mucilaginibacter rubeus]QEM15013.1 polysaccharide deacetylase family protein [Mucilaginibacter gossypii]QTE42271.1 polysaccharide deacetylase family protein [Mucilaginibacter rubeus]QTE48872.1 polysaccharide deacetylase family protein [Mucilaginibacter rubeus]QTE53969.1 polysaccharide deacetylase family protein [Mucilaginibacter rubeus]
MILLGFDVEEFDMPFEYGKSIPFDEQLEISTRGTNAILKLLEQKNIKVTFFCTANYAINRPDVIKQMVTEGHEVASHGYYHSDFKVEHLMQSKLALENISGTEVTGFRMARMMPVDEAEIAKAGYEYNSSINPTWLPGRYNNFDKPRTWFYDHDVLQIPASVSPVIRFPLFWLSFHNLPLSLLKRMASATLKKDGYLNLYFHPWEFTNLHDKEKFGFPGYVSRNSGEAFARRIADFIDWASDKGYIFRRTDGFCEIIKNKIKQEAVLH